MNTKLLILVVILILVCTLVSLKFLNNNKNIENFRYDNPNQKKTENIIYNTQNTIDNNNDTIDDSGELLIKSQNDILKTVTETNNNLNKNKDSINKIISELDVLKTYHTKVDDKTKNRTVLPQYKGKKCIATNLDLSGNAQGEGAINICAHHCNLDDNCVSFNYDNKNKKCRLSSLCSLRNTVNDNDFDLYFKTTADPNSPLTDFTLYTNKKCQKNSKKLSHNSRTLKECAEKCLDNPKCISFDYHKYTKKCDLTTNCYNQNAKRSGNTNLYQKKNIVIHPFVHVNNIPCKKKHRIVLHKFKNNFCIDNDGSTGRLRRCKNKGDSDNQTFVYDENRYLKTNKGKCLYYDNSGSGPQNNKPIKVGSCPKQSKPNYKWKFIKNNRGLYSNTLAIVSDLKNKSTGKSYAISANSGMSWLRFNGLVNNINNNNNSKLTLTEYSNNNKKHEHFSRWYRDYY